MKNERGITDAMYCDTCVKDISSCEACNREVFFRSDDRSYNICPGEHYISGLNGFRSWNPDPRYDVLYTHKICKNCTLCEWHQGRDVTYADLSGTREYVVREHGADAIQ